MSCRRWSTLERPRGKDRGVSDARARTRAPSRCASSGPPPKRPGTCAGERRLSPRARCSSARHASSRRAIGADATLLLGAAPYFAGDALIDVLLQLAFRRACFEDRDPPRTRAAFESAGGSGAAAIASSAREIAGLRRGLVRARRARCAGCSMIRGPGRMPRRGEETRGASCATAERRDDRVAARPDWLRQVPRYLEGRGAALAASACPRHRAAADPARARGVDLAPSGVGRAVERRAAMAAAAR